MLRRAASVAFEESAEPVCSLGKPAVSVFVPAGVFIARPLNRLDVKNEKTRACAYF